MMRDGRKKGDDEERGKEEKSRGDDGGLGAGG